MCNATSTTYSGLTTVHWITQFHFISFLHCTLHQAECVIRPLPTVVALPHYVGSHSLLFIYTFCRFMVTADLPWPSVLDNRSITFLTIVIAYDDPTSFISTDFTGTIMPSLLKACTLILIIRLLAAHNLTCLWLSVLQYWLQFVGNSTYQLLLGTFDCKPPRVVWLSLVIYWDIVRIITNTNFQSSFTTYFE